MKYSGLYFIPTAPNSPEAAPQLFATLIQAVESKLEQATRQNSWNLTHRMLRSTQIPNNTQQPPQSLQHMLQLSYLSPNRTYCYIQRPQSSQQIKTEPVKLEPRSNAPTPQPSQSIAPPSTSPGTIISIPANQSEAHISVLVNQLAAQWTFQRAHGIANGLTYTTGQFIINLGELRQSRPGSASMSNAVSAGVVLCATILVDEANNAGESGEESGYTSMNGAANEEEIDLSDAQDAVRALWGTLKEGVDFGKSDPREYMMATEIHNGEKQREAVVRMWCELLRQKG